jgi:Tfp pilus assembly protein PilP
MKPLRSKLHVLPLSVALIVFVALLGCVALNARAVSSENTAATGSATAQQEAPPQPVEATQPPPPPADLAGSSQSGREPAASPAVKDVQDSLSRAEFAFNPKGLPDPFKPFIAPTVTAPALPVTGDEDLETPPEPQRPLTPLQKMRISEIESGLKAIMWGPMGRKAVIEDASGKGYIVSVGTPAGERNGVVTEIFNDHLVIQQEYWDKKERRVIPQNTMVKLKKGKAEPQKP